MESSKESPAPVSTRRRRARIGDCPLCDRDANLTFHHLIPRKMHRRKFFQKNYSRQQLASGIYICRQCHSGIHTLFDEMTLAKQFNSLENLLHDRALRKHCRWVARQRTVSASACR